VPCPPGVLLQHSGTAGSEKSLVGPSTGYTVGGSKQMCRGQSFEGWGFLEGFHGILNSIIDGNNY
jgi:hypothetical protein